MNRLDFSLESDKASSQEMSGRELLSPYHFFDQADGENFSGLDLDERLYRFEEVCEALFAGQLALAKRRLEWQAQFLRPANQVRLYRVFLSALNYAIYHSMLERWGKSYHRLCYEHGLSMHAVECWEACLKVGFEILEHYAAALATCHRAPDTRIEKVTQYIKTHLSQTLSLEDLASLVYLNRSYLCSLFRQQMGESIQQYCTRLRMRQAEELLLDPSLRIEEIAVRCGYGNLSAFSTAFRRHLGVSPRAYRKARQHSYT